MFPPASPLQEGPVGVGHHLLLRLTDGVSLLFVRDRPALLDLTQLLQAVVKTLRGKSRSDSLFLQVPDTTVWIMRAFVMLKHL